MPSVLDVILMPTTEYAMSFKPLLAAETTVVAWSVSGLERVHIFLNIFQSPRS